MLASKDSYFTESDYEVFNAFPGMNPAMMRFMGVMKGIQTPNFQSDFQYLELGCGQGFTLNIYAALHPSGKFHGVDFAEGAIAGAKAMAHDAQLTNVTFEAASFANYAARETRQFDVIALHGIWTWVNRDAQLEILEIIRHRLKPGGLVYISSNMVTGRAQMIGPQQLMLAMRNANPNQSVKDLMIQIQQVLATHKSILNGAPRAKPFLNDLFMGSSNYFAHEMLTTSWRPVTLREVATDMAGVGLDFMGSSLAAGALPTRLLSEPHRSFIASFPDSIDQETAYDVLTHKEFRADLYVKNPQLLTRQQQHDMVLTTPFALINAGRAQTSVSSHSEIARVTGAHIYKAVVSMLRKGPSQVSSAFEGQDLDEDDHTLLMDTMRVLVAQGACAPGLDRVIDPEIVARAHNFNSAALRLQAQLNGTTPLASPYVRGAFSLSIIDSVALRLGTTGEQPVAALIEIAAANRLRVRHDGCEIDEPDAVRRMYEKALAVWPILRRPTLVNLGVLPS